MSNPVNLWQNRAFMRLWVAHVTSGAGTAITAVALPLIAVLMLDATPSQMGLLAAASSLPNLIFGFVAGVWVDRVRRRPLLVWADIGRALLLGSIPAAAWLGELTFLHLWIVAFAAGALTVFFQIAAISVLPSLVEKRGLVEANSKLSISDALLSIAGPAVAGGLVQLLSAAKAILVDAVSYLLSALALAGVADEAPQARTEPQSIRKEIAEGIHELLRTPILKTLTITSSLGMLAGSVTAAVQMLFLVDQLNFTPAVIGAVLACGGGGSLLGALLSGRAARVLHVGATLILGKLLWIAGSILLVSAEVNGREVVVVAAALALNGLGSTLYFVNQISLRQAVTAVRLLGRVTAARRFVLFGAATVGAFIGGGLGEVIGLRATLFVGALALAVELALIVFSPIRRARVE